MKANDGSKTLFLVLSREPSEVQRAAEHGLLYRCSLGKQEVLFSPLTGLKTLRYK